MTYGVIVLVVANILLGIGFGIREFQYFSKQREARRALLAFRPGQPRSTEQRTGYQLKWIDERAYTGVDGSRVQQTLSDFFEFEKLGYRFSPFVHYSNVPFSSPMVNVKVNSAGFDFRAGPAGLKSKSSNGVYIFGGSTTFGTHVADDWTFAAYLQDALPQAEVVNFGRPNYSWFQEMVLFQRLLHAGYRPKLAVFVDGVNVFAADGTPIWSDKLKDLWEEAQLNPSKKSYPDAIPLFRLVNFLSRRRQGDKWARLMASRTPVNPTSPSFIESYQNTRSQIQAIGKQFGVKTLFVLQPNRAVQCDGGQYSRPLPDEYTSTIQSFYAKAESLAKSGTLNLAGLCLEFGIKRMAFVDDVHYSPEFNRFIAAKLRPEITSLLMTSSG